MYGKSKSSLAYFYLFRFFYNFCEIHSMYNIKGVSFSTRYKRKTDDFRGGVCHEKNKKIQT